ncbi:MAG: hypothetical protein PHI38_09390 [Sulfurimonas sp.]|jgi:uncharacterized lipoprotein YehR (DUF1307 family)|nr:hypothetical protein [Sulfurimonas sp.]MDD3477069.1 hypothetical protein [Sulfurimonas sp.]HUH43489.1 hypothetical protein [Sulfurimonas sp.]
MSKVIIVMAVVLGIGFSACAQKEDEYHYNRAKSASEKALNSLDKE